MKKLYTLCLSLVFGATISVAQVDVGITDISDPVDGSNIETGSQLTVTFTVTNFGALIPTNDSLFFGLNFDDGPNAMDLYWVLTSDLATSGTLNLSTPPFPISGPLGPFEMCAYTMQPNDADASNDSTCNNYSLVVGIDDEPSVLLNNVFYSNEQLTVNISGYSVNNEVNLSVINITGQEVKNENFTISNSKMTKTIPMAGLAKGIYIVALRSESRPVQTQKIMVH